MKRLLAPVAAAALFFVSPWQPAKADLFVLGSSFNVVGTNSPDSFNDSVPLTAGAHSLDGGTLNLTISMVPDGGNEWLVFQYQTNGATAPIPLSQPAAAWELQETNLLVGAQDINFIADYGAFFDANLNTITPTNGIFGGTAVEANPIPGGTGTGVGASGFADPIAANGLANFFAEISPFDVLDGDGVPNQSVLGWEQALEFSPQTPLSAPEPASLALFGAGLTALGLIRRRKRA